MLDDGRHLGCIGRDVEEGMHVGKTIVGIKIVDTYETISIGCLCDLRQCRKPTKMTGVISLYAFNITASNNEKKSHHLYITRSKKQICHDGASSKQKSYNEPRQL